MPRMSRASRYGILGHDLDGIRAISLINAHSPRGADPVTVEEDHDLSHDLLLGPGRGDALGADTTNAIHFAKPVGLCFDDVEHFFAERPDQLLRVDRPDASDHAGGKILLDAVDGGRC